MQPPARTRSVLSALFLFALTFIGAQSTHAQTVKVLHSFGNGTDGKISGASLISDAVGNLYGTTGEGGVHQEGTVFELSPKEGDGYTETVLHSFGRGTDGAFPYAGLIFDAAGKLYGTTEWGGIHSSCPYGPHVGCGTVFEITP